MGRPLPVLLVAACLASSAVALTFGGCGLSVRGAPLDGELDGGALADAPSSPEPDDESQVPASCAAPQERCGEACVDLTSSSNHCGACDSACETGTVCEESACAVFCEADTIRCSGACVDPKTDRNHCGACGTACAAGLVCSAGACVTECATGLARCAVGNVESCVDHANDVAHCGACSNACAVGETCEAGACVKLCAGGGVLGDVFGPTMTGCRGRTRFQNRAAFCPPTTHVCTAAEYVQRRAGKRPTYNYWTNDNLRYAGSSSSCRAVAAGTSCGANPMRVCAGQRDPLGNECNWTRCGLGSNTPNEWFGGCVDNTTAGVLCCK